MAFKSLQQGHYPPPSTQSIVSYRAIHNHAIEPQGMHIGYPTTSLVSQPTYATYNHDLAWQQPQSVPTYGEVPNYLTLPDIQTQLHQSQWQKLTPDKQVLWDKFSPESKKVITTPVPNGDQKPPPLNPSHLHQDQHQPPIVHTHIVLTFMTCQLMIWLLSSSS